MPSRSRQLVDIAILALFAFAFGFVAYHYVVVKQSCFDDVFIYLHMVRNGVEAGIWQYFPVVERSALLASSSRSQLVSGTSLVSPAELWRMPSSCCFAPDFWGGWPLYPSGATVLLSMAIYFLSATAFSSSFDFESGLLFLWVLSLAAVLTWLVEAPRSLSLSLPIGGLIRPDLALLVYIIPLGVVVAEKRIRARLLRIPIVWLFELMHGRRSIFVVRFGRRQARQGGLRAAWTARLVRIASRFPLSRRMEFQYVN